MSVADLQFVTVEEVLALRKAAIALEKENLKLRHKVKYPSLSKGMIDYPGDVFGEIISGNSPYAFYLFQWVPYQTEARRFRLKAFHDVKHFDGRVELEVIPIVFNYCAPHKKSGKQF